MAGPVELEGTLGIPTGAVGLVLFAHGSGSSRHSPRNRAVAEALRREGLGTLLLDLLTPEEEAVDRRTVHLRFDIGLLADRLVHTLDWLRQQSNTRHLRIGLFGASTGAAAALVAAAERPDAVHAVVSRGGRPDLAGPSLPQVQAPTLLLVGGYDEPVLELNRKALEQLGCFGKETGDRARRDPPLRGTGRPGGSLPGWPRTGSPDSWAGPCWPVPREGRRVAR